MGDPNTLEAWLAVVSASLNCLPVLIWQVIVIGFIVYFREHIADLFSGLANLKVGPIEAAFQPTAAEAESPGGEAEAEIRLLGPGGFFTREGIVQLIENSGLVEEDESVVSTLLLFQTKDQRTWLIMTNNNVFCILDDEGTRATGRLIQWKLTLGNAKPVQVRAHKQAVGLVSIGERRGWLYSRRLHPDPDSLKQQIERLIADARKAGR